ncbi:SEC10/PgrA surface exclusion domain-containing protein [Gemella haemolysans]|uniref:SEC10/PgrA surface exclusion domain-containing protein n=1 Tax=Gemella haemolysans TaxID=1379 RepID=UPI00232C0C2F|nr:SEC10/PgrA surface exclusion domain-containing protein [Gemella haemolysans]MDB6213001.1 SEC10/PgrA surface exclusion domain-containing protein [Gemella haemolysans]
MKGMSEEERLKMSQYAMHLLNQVRKQFGLEPLKVNKNSMQIAKEISETMIRDNHNSLDAGHYVKGISEVAAKHDLIRGANYYENLYNAEAATKKDNIMSRNQLYEHVYNSVMLFFYEGISTNSYGHAQSLYNAKDPMGLSVANFENSGDFENVNRLPKELIEKYKQYINFDEFGNITGFKAMPINVFNEFDEAKAKLPKKSIIKISYINVKERNAIPGEVANHMPTYDDPSDEAMERAKENYKAKYSNESKDTVELPEVPDLESFKKAYEDAVKVRESKEQPVTDAQQEVDSATKELDTLKAIERKTEKATAKVQGIEDKITNLTTKAEEQQKVVDQLELDNVKYVEKMTKLAADLDAAQKDVEESAKLLDQAKALQKKTEDEISKLNTKIVELESDVKATEEELNKAKTDLEKIRMDRIQLDQNKEKLAKAQEEKAKLEEELKNLTTELDSIKKQLLEDTKEFEKIQRQYKLENFKWAVLADNNTIDPIEFDLEKYLRDEEEKKRQSEIIPEIPETPIKKEKPNLPGTPEDKNPEKLGELGKELNKDLIPGKEQTLEKDQNSGNPVDVAPGKLNNKPELQRPRINSNGLNTLPNTGESQTGMATVAGLVALAVASRLRKNKENN